jgi:hypothetical protein
MTKIGVKSMTYLPQEDGTTNMDLELCDGRVWHLVNVHPMTCHVAEEQMEFRFVRREETSTEDKAFWDWMREVARGGGKI